MLLRQGGWTRTSVKIEKFLGNNAVSASVSRQDLDWASLSLIHSPFPAFIPIPTLQTQHHTTRRLCLLIASKQWLIWRDVCSILHLAAARTRQLHDQFIRGHTRPTWFPCKGITISITPILLISLTSHQAARTETRARFTRINILLSDSFMTKYLHKYTNYPSSKSLTAQNYQSSRSLMSRPDIYAHCPWPQGARSWGYQKSRWSRCDMHNKDDCLSAWALPPSQLKQLYEAFQC